MDSRPNCLSGRLWYGLLVCLSMYVYSLGKRIPRSIVHLMRKYAIVQWHENLLVNFSLVIPLMTYS